MTKLSTLAEHEHIARWFFLIISLIIGYLFWQTIQPYAIVLMTAGVMAVVTTPLERVLRRKLGGRRGLSSLLIVFLVLIVIVVPLVITSIVMVNQAVNLVQLLVAQNGSIFNLDFSTNQFFQHLPAAVQNYINSFDLRAGLISIAQWASQHLGEIFSSAGTFLFKTFVFFICLYYFLVDRERLVHEALVLSPLRDKTDSNILSNMTSTIRAVVTGSVIVAVAQGVAAGIGMTIFGVPGALIWAALVIVAANIPFVGTASIMVPACVYLFLSGNEAAGIGLAIWSIIIVGSIDNFLRPIIVGGRTSMHPLLILLTILGGLQVFGPIGIIVGPTILAAFLSLVQLYKAGVLERQSL
jgi:predicted PurR-regulated permease PerM